MSGVHTPASATRSTIFNIATADAKDLAVYVNPYTARYSATRNPATDIVDISLQLHESLMTGSWLGDDGYYGDCFIELVAGWVSARNARPSRAIRC